jgi:hypothetical protein
MRRGFASMRAPIAATLSVLFARVVLAAPAEEDIRDIRGPKYVLPDWVLPAAILGVLLVAAAVYGIWRWRRNRRAAPLLPFEIALRRLEDIRSLMRPSQAREFSTAASDVVRWYIEQRFDVTATRRTTEEFLHDLLQSSSDSLARHQGLLGDFLYQCDFVKFAAQSLTVQNMETLRQSARAFVLETAKSEEPREGEETHDSVSAA